jgi:hypothetical protein
MLTAGEARVKSLQDLIVIREIRDIEEAIIDASTNGFMSVIVGITPTMAKPSASDPGYALATEYFNTWQGTRDDRQKTLQMNKVIQYFSDLGYTIDRQTNLTSNATFRWNINW